jgi:hypothetical protein
MREIVSRLNSSYLQNERSIWICEPESVSGASDLVVFLDGERYRGRVDALAVIEALRGQLANSWFVFVSEESPEAGGASARVIRRLPDLLEKSCSPGLRVDTSILAELSGGCWLA